MASDDSDYGGLIKFAIFIAIAVFSWIANATKKKQEQQEAEETQASLRRMDAEIRAAKKRAAPVVQVAASAPVVVVAEKELPVWVEAPSPAAPVTTWDIPQQTPSAPASVERRTPRPARAATRPATADVAAAGLQVPTASEMNQALVWREAFLPPLALREARF